PGVVVPQSEPGRQHRRVGMVELDADAAAEVADGKVGVQPAVLDAQVVEHSQGLAGEVAKLRMVALGFQFGDDDHGHDHSVLGESAERGRVGQQDAGVEDVGTPRLVRFTARAGEVAPRVTASCGSGHSISPGRLARRRVWTRTLSQTWQLQAQTCRRDRDRPAMGRAPALRSSRLRARTRSSRIRGPSRRAATHRPSPQKVPGGISPGKYRNSLFTKKITLRSRTRSGAKSPVTGGKRAQGAQEID